MTPSPLQLEHYELASLQIEPVDDYVAALEAKYPSFDGAEFESSVEFGEAARGEEDTNYLWGIRLRLKASPKEGSLFPYRFDVAIVGFLNGQKLPEANRQDLVLVNGASLLYGALRDEVLRLTSRMRHGPLMLPTAQFHSLAQSHGSGKQAQEKAALPASAKRRGKSGDSKTTA